MIASAPATDVVAVALLGAACWCALRATLATAWNVETGRDVDVVHALMGVSMAGTLLGWLSGAWPILWAAVFIAASAWFGRGLSRELAGKRCAGSGQSHLPHLAMSIVMIYMLISMRWTGMAAMGPGGKAAVQASGGFSYLAAGVALLLVANATLAALQGVGHARAVVAMAGGPGGRSVPACDVDRAPSFRQVLAPRWTAVCLIVMSLAMAYMLVGMRPS